jgi:hypothetical protein
MARNGAKDAARELLQQLEQMMENLQMATPDMNGDDLGDMMQELDELGDMIHEQQDLRDRTFRQGQDQRRRGDGPQGRQGQSCEFPGLRHGSPSPHSRLARLLIGLYRLWVQHLIQHLLGVASDSGAGCLQASRIVGRRTRGRARSEH